MTRELPTESFEVFQDARDALGMRGLTAIFRGHSKEQLYKWARPVREDLENGAQPNPIDWLCRMFGTLAEQGARHIAESGVQIVAGSIGMRAGYPEAVTPDAPTVEAECLDDYPALQAFHEAVLGKQPQLVVNDRLDAAIRELRETAAKAQEG